MGSLQTDDAFNRRKYGEATNVVSNMLLDIKERNKDAELKDLIEQCSDIASGQNKYMNDCTFPETEMQRKITEDSERDGHSAPRLCMLSGHLEGNYLKLLAEMSQSRRILEIGMFTGYSAVTLAESAYCEQLVTLDVEPYYESFLKSRLAGSNLAEKIKIMIGPANESLKQLKQEGDQFDFVFIDANKDGYLDYYKYIMDQGLLKPTGTIACDNILWYGRTYNQLDGTGQVLHEFVKFVKNDDRVYQVIIPIRDGLMIIKPKLQ